MKIAIVDGGFSGYSSLLGTALPASVTAIDHCSGHLATPPEQGGSFHGTGVAEIAHQMAPGAQLYLICIDSLVGLAQAEQDAIAAGVRVVNHSVGWFNTSRGDGSGGPGTPDAIVADARAHGILWVNAAGDSTQHWSGTFTPNASAPEFNDFAPGDALDTVQLPAGGSICAALKWDAWPTTNQDYDLYAYDSASGALVEFSDKNQADDPQAPTEELCFENTTASTRSFGIAIVKYQATTTPRFDLFVLRRRRAAVPGRGREPDRAGHLAARPGRGRELLPLEPLRKHDRVFSPRGPTDRRPHEARPARARRDLELRLRREHRQLRERLHRHLGRHPPRRRRCRAPAAAHACADPGGARRRAHGHVALASVFERGRQHRRRGLPALLASARASQ